jgi:hypothetical protein
MSGGGPHVPAVSGSVRISGCLGSSEAPNNGDVEKDDYDDGDRIDSGDDGDV